MYYGNKKALEIMLTKYLSKVSKAFKNALDLAAGHAQVNKI